MADEVLLRSVRSALDAPMADCFRIGHLRAGVLQILAADSVTLQELNFQKRKILRQLQIDVPGKVTNLRFKIAAGT